MKSIFYAEQNKGGVVTNVFAEITKRDSCLIIRPLTEKERREMNERPYYREKSDDIPK